MSTPQLLERDLQQIALGDTAAFRRLYEATSAKLFSVSYTMLRRSDWAEEALQDTFIKVWHRAADYSVSKGSVMSWLISIVRYRSIDLLRNRANQELSADDFDELPAADMLESTIESLGQAKNLRMCMDELQPTTRQCIQLAFVCGLSHQEVSEHISEALGSVKSWIRRGLDSLKRCLQR
ncbi:sigma-70 family RNA polymerase sigma factor [Rheinheimera sp. UJ51]|uniref:sigma-70 family RNA polymerase sigma factor n=1 Tax=unclassified Rheinheimera TaxID=115860 RepID=UPI001E46EA72|nr:MULTISPECIES: sigma-70 family RNA polymerase sigma factor [unclassified Rheinheimera]MCC5452307.1 sigma-70 family RNA polymerase sigma factor [Rheinheimera sp. UJ51]MCF4008919.1 sigma-70 family RNA polymerase sigma factor [Rheinheimera sp. UJ63]